MAAYTLQLPSVQLDAVAEDLFGASQGQLTSTETGPFSLADGQTLTIDTNTASGQTVTFLEADFEDISVATADEVAAVISAALVGASADADQNEAIVLTTDSYGVAATAEVTGGTAAAAFGFPAGPAAGTDSTTGRVVINCVPEPGEVEVPLTSRIEFQIFDSSGTAPSVVSVEITVNGMLAFSGGTFQSGFNGGLSATSLVDAATRSFVVDFDDPYDSQTLIVVEVTAGSLDTSWSFVTADTTPPNVSDAVAVGPKTIRVTFDEPVKQTSVSAADDALNPANYTFSRISTYAVDVVPVSVTTVNASTVDIELDIYATFGATYQVVVENVVDLRGNVVSGPPNNTLSFVGYNPTTPAGRRFVLWDWIPEFDKESDQTHDLYKFVHVLQEPTNVLLYEIDRFGDFLDPDTSPESQVDAMLADMGNPFAWDLDFMEKKRLLGVLAPLYKLKGTDVGIVSAIRFLIGVEVTLVAAADTGWELGVDELGYNTELGPGTQRLLYSFDIVSPVALTDEQRERMLEVANYMKRDAEHVLRIVEPETPLPDELPADHVELGISQLGFNWQLH